MTLQTHGELLRWLLASKEEEVRVLKLAVKESDEKQGKSNYITVKHLVACDEHGVDEYRCCAHCYGEKHRL